MPRMGEITLKAVKMSRIVAQNGQNSASNGEKHQNFQSENNHLGQPTNNPSLLLESIDQVKAEGGKAAHPAGVPVNF